MAQYFLAWKAILLELRVAPDRREEPRTYECKRGCAGILSIYLLLPGGQYIAKGHKIQLCTAFQADMDSDSFLSEGILSFVEYAPRFFPMVRRYAESS